MTKTIGLRADNPITYRIYNCILAASLLLVLLPLLVVLTILLFATQGASVFYRGPRLGKDEKPFNIIKFRTLCSKRAKEVTKDRTLPANSNIETPLGTVLRETRLDELPQLVNVLLGDMNMCGPRPVRAEIAQVERQRIPSYETRFEVKPGLFGPTQAYFGHGASKRLRARMNNLMIHRPVNIPAELALFTRIATSILMKMSRKVTRKLFSFKTAAERNSRADIWVETATSRFPIPVERIGNRRVAIDGRIDLNHSNEVDLCVRLDSGALRRARIVIGQSEKQGVYEYSALTEFGEFIVERYALGGVVVPPRIGKVLQPNARLVLAT